MRAFASICLLVLLAGAAYGQDNDAASAFPKFCEEWMEKLDARERANVSHIKWEQRADGVLGTYVGYSREHTCELKEGTHSTPVGTITYRELRYEKRGNTQAEAEHSVANPIETTEVTEIFRYDKGKWIY
jgi:hypothetical protein